FFLGYDRCIYAIKLYPIEWTLKKTLSRNSGQLKGVNPSIWTVQNPNPNNRSLAKTTVQMSVQFDFGTVCDTLNSTEEYHYGKKIYR
ncbi:MAG: hypothetical protein Q4B72_15555, partial [Lachnospiraceae bacterium]|nr:hypothetical protein [Lachnospiraceae bacterium]